MRSLLVFFVATISTSTASAQINLGVKGGLNIVSIDFASSNNNFTQSGFRLSYHAGIYEQYNVSDKFSIRVEQLYSNKGVLFASSFNIPAVRTNINLNYLSLPILAKYRIWDQLSVMLGPEVSYLLSAKSRSADHRSDVGFIYDRKIDLGIATGLGYQVSKNVEVGVRYIHGLLDVIGDFILTDEQGNPTNIDPKSQNRTFQLSVGYRLQ